MNLHFSPTPDKAKQAQNKVEIGEGRSLKYKKINACT